MATQFRRTYTATAKTQNSANYSRAMACAEGFRRGQEGAERIQIADTIDGLVGRFVAAGSAYRMAWPIEIALAAGIVAESTEPIVGRYGRLLWVRTDGTRRGTRYAERHEGQTEPHALALWSESQRTAGGRGYAAGTFAGVGR
jgi:hypothetical protein